MRQEDLNFEAATVTSDSFRCSNFVILVASVLLVVGLIRTAWLGDDALIMFRSTLNWLHGYGPIWNIDERVQVFTCPLWFLLITAATAITGEPYITTIFLSLGVTLASVIILAASSWRVGGWGLALALIGLALSRSFVEFATSGLENGLSFLLIALSVVAVESQKPRDASSFALSAFLMGLSLVNRLDLLFLLAPLGALAVWRCSRPRSVLAGAMIGILPLIAWHGFALLYYGSAFPNTAYAKLGGGIAQIDMLAQGIRYVIYSFTTDPVGLIVVLASLVFSLRGGSVERRMLASGVLVYMGYVVWIGGDFMVWRFVAVPVFASAIIISRSSVRFSPPLGLSSVAGLLLISWYAGSPYLSPSNFGPAQQTGTRGIVIERAWYFPPYGLVSPTRSFPDLSAWDGPPSCSAQEPQAIKIEQRIGIVGLESGPCTHIIDVVALADPLLARLPAIDVGDLRIGHFFRNIPEGYEELIANNDNRILDPAVRELYAAVRHATRGPLWTAARWKAIGDLAFGHLDQPEAFASLRTPPFPTHSLDPSARAAPYGPLEDGVDTEYYKSRNYDVSMLGRDPIEHYKTFGWREGRQPNTLFNPQYYIEHYGPEIPDGMDPLEHYLRIGWRLGFRPSDDFDPQSYLDLNPDLAAANINPMIHYLQSGYREGRQW